MENKGTCNLMIMEIGKEDKYLKIQDGFLTVYKLMIFTLVLYTTNITNIPQISWQLTFREI